MTPENKQRMRRLYRMLAASNMQPPTVSEMEQALSQWEEPTPVPGMESSAERDAIEGGFINDQSGEATRSLRKQYQIEGGR